MTNPQVYTSLFHDKRLVEAHLHSLLEGTMPHRGPVLEAMRYSVLGCGQRLRPLLALRIARMMHAPMAGTLEAAASVELFHCASLIIDDLPCMDDSPTRRDRPSVHVAYGESTAILAAFGLVALAARSVMRADVSEPERLRRQRFQLFLLNSLDVDGLIAGQALDLVLSGDLRNRNRDRMTELKTVPLFELAVRAGLMLGTYNAEEEQAVVSFGRLFGAAYQSLDDVLDGEVDSESEPCQIFSQAIAKLSIFGSRAGELHELIDYLHGKLKTENRRNR
jgi:geranylgeranyl pyrophosphate synthase